MKRPPPGVLAGELPTVREPDWCEEARAEVKVKIWPGCELRWRRVGGAFRVG